MPALGDCIDGVRDGDIDGLFDGVADRLGLFEGLGDLRLVDGDVLCPELWLGVGREELFVELLDDADVGTGGGGGDGGTFWNSNTAMSKPVNAMKRVSNQATTVVDQPALSRRPGHGNGQVRTRPVAVSSIPVSYTHLTLPTICSV